MSSSMQLRSVAAVFALLAMVPAPSQAQPAPVTPPAVEATDDSALQAAISKSNAYTSLMNRTLRAIQSWERYASWVDMKQGPTGRERYISYGLYSLYDVTGEIAKAQEAMARAPALPEIDQTIKRYIAAYQTLAPLVTRAERYYERGNYKDDKLAEGRELHTLMVPAATGFLQERATLDAQMRVFKGELDGRELAAIEKAEGRSARWQIRNIMVAARRVMDVMPSNGRPIVDLAAFDAALTGYSGAMREMDRFKDANPAGVPFVESQASSWLGDLRELRDKLGRSKGDARRGAANDVNGIVSTYNTMISLADTAASMPR